MRYATGGIPVDIHEDIHAGGKFDQNSYKVSGSLRGVVISVVDALSDWLELRIWRNQKEYFIKFKNGDSESSLAIIGEGIGKKGTEVTFMPSISTFTNIEFNFATLEHRLRELAFLNSGVRIVLTDDRYDEKKEMEFCFTGGVEAYVKYIDRTKIDLYVPISLVAHNEEKGISLECAMQWNDSYHVNILCFTNNIRQRDGGAHLIAFKAALTRIVNSYLEKWHWQKNQNQFYW